MLVMNCWNLLSDIYSKSHFFISQWKRKGGGEEGRRGEGGENDERTMGEEGRDDGRRIGAGERERLEEEARIPSFMSDKRAFSSYWSITLSPFLSYLALIKKNIIK